MSASPPLFSPAGWGELTPIIAAVVHDIGSVLAVMASASLAIFSEKS
jgi:hypothetical protein